jgi:hypothetical protein
MFSALGTYFGAIDWTKLTTGLVATFEDGVELALPVAGTIIAAFVVFKAIRRFVKA